MRITRTPSTYCLATLFLSLATLLYAAEAQAVTQKPDTDPPFTIGGDEGAIGERIDILPEDGHGWHTTVFTPSTPAAKSAQILAWFNSGDLLRLKQQTHFHHYKQGTSIFDSYANINAVLPCVVVQDKSGKIIFKASGQSSHLDTAATLTRAIAVSIYAYKHPEQLEDCCPRPRPDPPYEPQPGPDPLPNIPDLGPLDEVPLDPLSPAPAGGIVEAAAVGVAVLTLLALPVLLVLVGGLSYVAQRNRSGV